MFWGSGGEWEVQREMERGPAAKNFTEIHAGGLRRAGRSLYNKHVTEKYDTIGGEEYPRPEGTRYEQDEDSGAGAGLGRHPDQ